MTVLDLDRAGRVFGSGHPDVSLPQEFPPVIPLITLAGVLVLTRIVIRGPLRGVTRIRPGTAPRYQ
jgi:hypothetical protein